MDRGSECYARFLAGEPEGLTALIEEYRDGLILYLCSIVGDYGAAEELAEDTFVKLLLKRPKDRGTGAFKTWLYTIGRHLALDRMRKQKREVSVPPEALGVLLQGEDDFERTLFSTERDKLLFAAMRRLRPDYFQVLWLRYFEGLSGEQTAKAMGRSRNATGVLAARARAALKKELEQEGIGYEDL